MSKIRVLSLIIILQQIYRIHGLWPPNYKINLTHSETFIISDMFDSDYSEEFLTDDLEIVKPKELLRYKFKDNANKYYRLHQIAMRKNREYHAISNPFIVQAKDNKIKEEPYETMVEPYYAGFVDKNGDMELNHKNVYYANEMAKTVVERQLAEIRKEKTKKEIDATKKPMENYDYNNFEKEYAIEIKKEQELNETMKYVEVKEEDNKDSVKNMLGFKNVTNCTTEEMKGIGLSAARCFVQDFGTEKTNAGRFRIIKRAVRISAIWFSIYLIIAIPLWCTRGWCCCCCRCKFCKPRRIIDDAKMFLANNPIGVIHTADGVKHEYTPTNYERYTQRALKHAIMRL